MSTPSFGGTSSTYVNSPIKSGSINQGESGAAMGAAQGAAMGAAAGTAILPGVGTIIGGALGAVGGWVSGAFADKGKVYERKARKWEQLGKQREAAIQVRDVVRNFRVQRAMAMTGIAAEAGGTQSTSTMGAVSAGGSQYTFGANFTQGQMFIQGQQQKFLTKAGKSYNNAKNGFAMLDAATTVAGSFGGYGLTDTPSPTGTSGVSQSALGSNNYAGGNWSSFAPPQPFGGSGKI
jgi:hypothetical protein